MAANKLVDKARAAVKKKNFEYAAELFVQYLKAHPDDVDVRLELRVAERAQKKLSGGGSGFMAKARAKKLEAQAMMIRANKDPEKAMIACEELLKQDPDVALALLRLGEAASYADLNQVAVFAFKDVLHLDKQNKEAWRLLGRVHEAAGELPEALKCFERLLKLEPKDPEALDKVKKIPASITSKGFQEGAKKGFQGLIDQDEAQKLERNSARIRTPEQALERISELEKKLDEDPKDVKTMRLIAELYVKADNAEEAVRWCDKALQTDPNYFLASELRGDLVLKRYEEQLKKYEAHYRKQPSDQVKKKVIQLRRDKAAFEVEEYRRRFEAHPTEFGRALPLGKCLYDGGQIDDAINALQKAKQDARSKTEAGYYLGQCFIKKKIYKLALKELNHARDGLFEMEGLAKDITYLIGRIYETAKHPDKALNEYEKIAEADFTFKDVTKRIEALSTL